ncbi:hypothetical protein IPJ70_00495 [Candidatus Campbellbacteria bacterium]|nr:MAG: hypothetical protein IPJ70_00495 [Candidatus Campbellbacteria bacterium]
MSNFDDTKGKEDLRRKALEETASAQRLIKAQEERRKQQHAQIVQLELSRLNQEIKRAEQERASLVLEEDSIKRQEAEEKRTVESTVTHQAQAKTETLDISRTQQKLESELAELTKKKETLTATLKKMAQEHVTRQRAKPTISHIQKNAGKEGELKRELVKLEKDMETLKKIIAADEARLREEKATCTREEAEKKKIELELSTVQKDAHKEEVVGGLSAQQEKKIQQESEQIQTVLGAVERSIQDVMRKLRLFTTRGQKQKRDTQENERTKRMAEQAVRTADTKLRDRERRLKQLDADIRTKKEKKEKLEAELR